MRNLIAAGLRRLSTPEPAGAVGSHDATVIAVSTSKGGVGKTTSAVHLAAGLSLRQRRTLIVDMDPQGHVGASLRQITPPRPGALASLLMDDTRREVMDVAVRTSIDDLHVTAPDQALLQADKALTGRIGREFLLRRALRRTRTWYDYIILDCPPNLGNLTLNALLAADALIVPCDPSVLAMQGVADLLAAVDTIEDQLSHRPALLGVLRTRVDRRNKRVHEAMDAALSRTYGASLFRSEIRINTALARAQMAGDTVWSVEPRSSGAADYAALVDEVIGRVEGPAPPN